MKISTKTMIDELEAALNSDDIHAEVGEIINKLRYRKIINDFGLVPDEVKLELLEELKKYK